MFSRDTVRAAPKRWVMPVKSRMSVNRTVTWRSVPPKSTVGFCSMPSTTVWGI